jgi:hypothetical protein
MIRKARQSTPACCLGNCIWLLSARGQMPDDPRSSAPAICPTHALLSLPSGSTLVSQQYPICRDCLQHTAWRESRQRLLDALKATLAEYYMRIQQASPDEPVIIPSAHWVSAGLSMLYTVCSVISAGG